MIDPLAAIGLAGNIVQFVDFSVNLFCESKALYNSASGANVDNVVIETIAKDLNILSDGLTGPPLVGAIPDPIRNLARQCKDVAKDLLEVIESIQVKGCHERWRSFVQALRSVRKKEEIEVFVRRMERLRSEMQFRLQILLSEQHSEIRGLLTSLVDENKKLQVNGVTNLQNLVEDVLCVVSQLRPEAQLADSTIQDLSMAIQNMVPVDMALMKRLSDNMQDLASKLSSLASEIGITNRNLSLLKSLQFKQLRVRHEAIASAHKNTFEWIYAPSSPIKFKEWVRSQNGIYWITGKPGSGKSTLIKFLHSDPRTMVALKSWAGHQRLVLAKFFFWRAGSDMQKSQKGLLQSLLFEVLRQCPDLIQTVCASKIEDDDPIARDIVPWTLPELQKAINELKNHSGLTARFCFFIDGLDEYAGEPMDIVEVLESLRSWPDVKLCVSSRPWNEFIDAFGQSSDHQLALEYLNQDDIREVVRVNLEENLRFKALRARDERGQELVSEIIHKARGVFLWVILVVRTLLRGLTNADRIVDLQRRLRSFPDTLEEYFRHMLDSVDNEYREQTAQTFRIALEAEEPLSLMTYSFLDEENLDLLFTSPFPPLTTGDVLTRQDDMKRRLNARCKGLLEVVNIRDTTGDIIEDGFRATEVDFLHRTVYDFLMDSEYVQKLLVKNLKPDFSPKMRICMAILAQAQSLRSNSHTRHRTILADLAKKLVDRACGLEDEMSIFQKSILDELGNVVRGRLWSKDDLCLMRFLLTKGSPLYRYVDESLEEKPWLLESKGPPLLMAALGWSEDEKIKRSWYDDRSSQSRYESKYDMGMAEILLRRGASPNQTFEDTTVWGYFMLRIANRAVPKDSKTKQTVELFLRYGANPDTEVVVKHRTNIMLKRTHPVSQNTHSNDEEHHPLHATQRGTTTRGIIEETWGETEARKMVDDAKKPEPNRISSSPGFMS